MSELEFEAKGKDLSLLDQKRRKPESSASPSAGDFNFNSDLLLPKSSKVIGKFISDNHLRLENGMKTELNEN